MRHGSGLLNPCLIYLAGFLPFDFQAAAFLGLNDTSLNCSSVVIFEVLFYDVFNMFNICVFV